MSLCLCGHSEECHMHWGGCINCKCDRYEPARIAPNARDKWASWSTIAVVATFLIGCSGGGGGHSGGGNSHALTGWTANYQPGQDSTSQIKVINGLPQFDYPTTNNREINVLAKGVKGQLTQNSVITVEFTIEPTGVRFQHDDGGNAPARIVLFVQVCGDDYRSTNGRWWYPGYITLPPKNISSTIQASMSGVWTNVQGGQGRPPADRICNAGLAFGGGNAHTHGNWALGSAHMTITRFEVN